MADFRLLIADQSQIGDRRLICNPKSEIRNRRRCSQSPLDVEGQIFCVRLHMAREDPAHPVVGVGAVVVRDGRALVVRRAHEPRKGEWSLPGGLLDLGESLVDAARREVKEETGLDVEVGPMIETFDRVHRDGGGRIRYHFVIIDFVCWSKAGEAVAGSDAEAVAWVTAEEVDRYGVNAHAKAVILKGLEVLRS
jgi:ADP-ribose pyrophosphatase YjhB (NUDIX family)